VYALFQNVAGKKNRNNKDSKTLSRISCSPTFIPVQRPKPELHSNSGNQYMESREVSLFVDDVVVCGQFKVIYSSFHWCDHNTLSILFL
jgi:hypothetical protein